LKLTTQAYREQGPLPEQQENEEKIVDNPDMFTYEDEFVVPELPSDARNLTVDMLLGDQKKKPRQLHMPFLLEMTHLMMNRRKLSSVI
jgi:hypothetical protein